METNKLLCPNAYLYSLKNGILSLYRGDVWKYEEMYRTSKYAKFVGRGKKVRCLFLSGQVYNGLVWLDKRDDYLAKRLMIESEERMIREYSKKVRNHQSYILSIQESSVESSDLF